MNINNDEINELKLKIIELEKEQQQRELLYKKTSIEYNLNAIEKIIINIQNHYH